MYKRIDGEFGLPFHIAKKLKKKHKELIDSIKELEKRLEKLEARVRELEEKLETQA